MNVVLILALVVACGVVLLGGLLGWQLLRQNGRLLLRVEELEERLNELEFGESESDQSGEVGSLNFQPTTLNSQPDNQSLVSSTLHSSATEDGAAATNGDDRAKRFGNRPLARSKIKRDGLKAGTPAPDFRLPRLDGKGELALEDLRGRRVLLVFSDPHCGPCNALAPELEKFHHEQTDRDRSLVAAGGHAKVLRAPDRRDEVPSAADGDRPRSEGIAVVMISRGEPKGNRAKVEEHGLTFPIVLQQQWEISRRYAMFATPVAYLIDEAGVIERDVAVGVESVLAILWPCLALAERE